MKNRAAAAFSAEFSASLNRSRCILLAGGVRQPNGAAFVYIDHLAIPIG